MRLVSGSRRRQETGQRAASSLVRETEAFLSGNYADQFARRPRLVPAWVAMNPVAHGELARLQALVRSTPDPRKADLGTRCTSWPARCSRSSRTTTRC
jgi:hypothetical protein